MLDIKYFTIIKVFFFIYRPTHLLFHEVFNALQLLEKTYN